MVGKPLWTQFIVVVRKTCASHVEMDWVFLSHLENSNNVEVKHRFVLSKKQDCDEQGSITTHPPINGWLLLCLQVVKMKLRFAIKQILESSERGNSPNTWYIQPHPSHYSALLRGHNLICISLSSLTEEQYTDTRLCFASVFWMPEYTD